MKPTLKCLLLLSITIILISCGAPAKKNQIYGTWKIIAGKNNGTDVPKILMDRKQSFTFDNTFQTMIKTPEEKDIVGNSGFFYLINDTTMVTYHKDQSGNIDNIANTYNFKIQNDSLHFHGFYLSQTPENPAVLIKIFIDEWWVRVEKK